jgi:hypothetical protein
MLEELSDHIMDVAMNAVRAGATCVRISLAEDRDKNLLTFSIADNGAGMTEEVARSVTDPFFSTKQGKKVGLGVPLLKQVSEMCDGTFSLESKQGDGTRIEVGFALDHPDRPPVGNIRDTVLLLCVSNPDVRFVFDCAGGGRQFHLDTEDVASRLSGVPINHPEVVDFLKRYIEEKL